MKLLLKVEKQARGSELISFGVPLHARPPVALKTACSEMTFRWSFCWRSSFFRVPFLFAVFNHFFHILRFATLGNHAVELIFVMVNGLPVPMWRVGQEGCRGGNAAENDDLEMIGVLLQAGAPLEAEGSASRTPLLTAVSRGRDQIAMGMRLGLSGSL